MSYEHGMSNEIIPGIERTSTSRPDVRTDAEKETHRANAAAWLAAYYALTPAQKAIWQTFTPAQMEASKQLTAAQLTASMSAPATRKRRSDVEPAPEPAPAASAAIAAIAAELIAIMAANDRSAAA